MKRFLISAAAAGLVAGGAAIAQTAPKSGQPAPRAHKMQTESRADVQAQIGKMFARFDSNKDGFVTKAEVDAKDARRSAKIKERAEKRAQGFDSAKIFDKLDANHDGKVTKAEAEGARESYVASKSGEPAHAHAVAMGGLFDRADTNKDGVISRAEFDAAAQLRRAHMDQAAMHRGGFAGRLFERADINKDSRVSLAEAQQVALQHFDRADLNHDGKLTPEERRQARQQLRAQHKPS